MRRYVILFLSILFAAVGFAATARAQDIGKPDPKGAWRELTQTTGTSPCLGDPRTPICAVETEIACTIRATVELCDSVTNPKAPSLYEAKERPNDWIWYRIVLVKRVASQTDHPPWLHYLEGYHFETGDVQVDVDQWRCNVPVNFCPRVYLPPETYITRRFGDHWTVITWSAPNSDEWEDWQGIHDSRSPSSQGIHPEGN
jgi:hypothetical protein